MARRWSGPQLNKCRSNLLTQMSKVISRNKAVKIYTKGSMKRPHLPLVGQHRLYTLALDQFWLCSGTLWYVCRVILTSPNGNIFRVIGPLWGKHRSPVDSLTKASDVFFDLCLNKRLIKQSKRRWFETPLRSLWRHCDEVCVHQWMRRYFGASEGPLLLQRSKWKPFRRWHFQMHFLQWKCLNSDKSFTEVCS